jgi:hypothetical protein
MRIIRFISLTALVSVSLAAGIEAALQLTRLKPGLTVALHSPAIASIDSTLAYPSQHGEQSASFASVDSSQANILQLPKASTDFVGYWGGYIDSSVQRLSPDLIGNSPDRVSVVFGRQGDTVFMASELYSSPKQKIVHGPKARIVSARLAIIEYESEDSDLYYIYSHRFRLNGTFSISYRSTIDVYDRNSHRLMGIVTERAALKRLRTPHEQLEFARPGRNQIPRAEVFATAGLEPP